ncbi:hypothetical protein V6N13_122339 [Hibiscus sabdariffa]|uniref:Protein kinase domain-containing protein n=1 Tax=Hibiscus sabdariffa TaxID=183260 RepID=A0ABR2Q7Z6_9ROSI
MRRIQPFIVSHALLFLTLASIGTRILTISLATTEKEILLQFKGNITKDLYNSLRSWVPSGNPCVDFSGVFCNPNGFVDKIVLWNTSLSGQLSASLSGLSSIRVLTLFGNRFSGNIPPEYSLLQTLWKINVSSNALSGPIPGFIGNLPSIRFLDLSKNGYSGEIPFALFKNCYKTKYVSFSHNSLSSSIPGSIVNCSMLEGFDFSFNNLTGELPSGICDLSVLKYLSIGNNALSGNVIEEMSNCQSLLHLDLSRNSFTGLAPLGVIELKNITYFNVSHNGLNGSIPVNIADLGRLVAISLANNSLNGTIPAGFGSIEVLQVLDLHNLNLAGGIPADVSNCRFLRELDVSGNTLEGQIPDAIYNMSQLEILDLHGNKLNGSITYGIGNLSKLQFLDLSQNSLSGSIPSSLANLTMLAHFNLSYNNLSGTIPFIQTIQSFGPTAFFNNPRLCGFPLTSCSLSGRSPTSGRTRVLSVSAIVAIVAAAMILTGVCVVTIMNIRARRSKTEEVAVVVESTQPGSSDSNVIIGKLVLFSKSLPSKYEDWETGTKALLDKDSLIGGGSIGTVYRSSFEGGISIAVKKLETLGRIRNQDEFEQEIGRLGNIKHPNLVALQGYYWSLTMQLILSEFISNGNLYDNLHGLNYPDENYEAKLSDYGLGRLLPILDNYGLTKFHNAVGYVAPELAQSLRFSEKCDVYSFGVILLELVTGRKPVESPTVNEVVILCEYVRGLLERGSASDCFDRRLWGFAENELIQVMKLGLICSSEVPSRRPSMSEVVQVLEAIRSSIES